MKTLDFSTRALTVRSPIVNLLGGLFIGCAPLSNVSIGQVPIDSVKDLTLEVASDMPCVWPIGMTPFAVVPTKTFGSGTYRRDMLIIDEHTGTQWDAPAHFIPPPDSGLPDAGPNGLITGEKVPAWQFVGEACVVDICDYRDQAADGASYLIQPDIVAAWEKDHRPLSIGDVVLFRSDYSDDRYKPLHLGGERFVATVVLEPSKSLIYRSRWMTIYRSHGLGWEPEKKQRDTLARPSTLFRKSEVHS